MCYFNTVKVGFRENVRLRDLSEIVKNDTFLNHLLLDAFTYPQTPILKAFRDTKEFEVTQMEWGFLRTDNSKWPFLHNREDVAKMRFGDKDLLKGFQKPFTTQNAMAEELLKPNKIYRDAALHRRCIFLSSGFVEWRHIQRFKKTGEPLKTMDKYPYYIYVPGMDVFPILGVYDTWTDEVTGETVDTASMVTTEANFGMRQIHNAKLRQPSISNLELAHEWMFGNLTETDILTIAKTQFPWQQMEAYTIAKDFKKALNPLEKFDYDPSIVPELTKTAA